MGNDYVLLSYASVLDKYYFDFQGLSQCTHGMFCCRSRCCKQLILTMMNLSVSLIAGLHSCWYITCVHLECVVCS